VGIWVLKQGVVVVVILEALSANASQDNKEKYIHR
jgi:hypothetical protein